MCVALRTFTHPDGGWKKGYAGKGEPRLWHHLGSGRRGLLAVRGLTLTLETRSAFQVQVKNAFPVCQRFALWCSSCPLAPPSFSLEAVEKIRVASHHRCPPEKCTADRPTSHRAAISADNSRASHNPHHPRLKPPNKERWHR